MAFLVLALCYSLLVPNLAFAVLSREPVSSATTRNRLVPNDIPVDCSAARYGANVRSRSVRNAWAKISRSPSPVTFEMRQLDEEPGWRTNLPNRIISGEFLWPEGSKRKKEKYHLANRCHR